VGAQVGQLVLLDRLMQLLLGCLEAPFGQSQGTRRHGAQDPGGLLTLDWTLLLLLLLLMFAPGQASGREIWIWTFQFLVDRVVNPVDTCCGNLGENRDEHLSEYLEQEESWRRTLHGIRYPGLCCQILTHISIGARLRGRIARATIRTARANRNGRPMLNSHT
jgi:hypothetical protein